MRMKSFFWPWSEIAELRQIIERQRSRLFGYSATVNSLREDLEDACAKANEERLRVVNAEIEIRRLRELLAKAEFRDPTTGKFTRRPR